MKFLRRSVWIFTALMITVPLVLFGLVHWYENKFEKLPVLGGYDLTAGGMPVQHIIGTFEFTNQDGKTFSNKMVVNKIVVANFFFTSCAGICPNMMQHVKTIQNYFLKDPAVSILSFTVDPSRDSAQRLHAYAARYGIIDANWNLLTGNKREIYKLARKSFYLTAGEGDGGENDFIHSEQLVLVDKYKHIRGYYSGNDDKAIKQLIKDIKKLKHEN